MVYMSGDNSLDDYVVRDIEQELAVVGSSSRVQVLVLADRRQSDRPRGDSWSTTKLFHILPGMLAISENAIQDWGERDMGNVTTLIQFVSWCRGHYPATHYALFFWGHGWNWHPGYTMFDETDSNALDQNTLEELRSRQVRFKSLKPAIRELGYIDVIGYDGCNMASIEVDYLWHGSATVVTSSQEYVGWDGVYYDTMLRQLQQNPDMSADELAVIVSQSAIRERTWSAVAVDHRLDTLITAVNDYASALSSMIHTESIKLKRAFSASQSFWNARCDRDLYDLALKTSLLVPSLSPQCQAVMNAINSVVLDEHHDRPYSGAHGTTIYLMSQANDGYFDFYKSLSFANNTLWDEFLTLYRTILE